MSAVRLNRLDHIADHRDFDPNGLIDVVNALAEVVTVVIERLEQLEQILELVDDPPWITVPGPDTYQPPTRENPPCP